MNEEIHTVWLWCKEGLSKDEEKAGIAFCSYCYDMYRKVAWKVK